ncbi:GTP cyclohydrolase I FolE [Schumannella sp. 10F1B-5-1]|uniref:GTP cyclohydrolase I FolE n=1 Tax=Schumannella sp. 10F1B-5-1 TaxID=2590780 RepID=UPI0011323F73|nr:GTP cyclohydrolase I FolE [Schumannella sp. 10F1B-5-1]TPW71626.1 GTP cyclohydrolase I FolE [Schumannella sp. 10F1B-5-1]
MAIDTGRIEAAVSELIRAIGDDPDRPELASTPARVATAYTEFFAGIGVDPLEVLGDPTEIDLGAGETGEIVALRDIEFRSVCEHHLLPFTGVAHVAYLPDQHVVGLGRIPRVVEVLSSRPQLQERLTEQIASALDAGLSPRGVLVVMDARHACVGARGVRQSGSSTVTVASRGELRDPVARAEVMGMFALSRGVDGVGAAPAAPAAPAAGAGSDS